MNDAAATDAALISSMVSSGKGKPGAFSAPLQEPAKFATVGAQVGYEMTELARRGLKPEGGGQEVRGAKAAAVRDLGKVTPTKEEVLEEFRRADLRPLWLGRIAFLWSAGQPDRAAALKQLKRDLVKEDLVSAAGRLDQFITIYWVAMLLGWDEAQDLRVAALRELRRLVARNAATEEFALRRACEQPARALWRRMLKDRLTAAAVKIEVDKIRPRKPASVKMNGRSGAVLKLLKQVKLLKEKEALRTLLRAVRDRLIFIDPDSADDSAVA